MSDLSDLSNALTKGDYEVAESLTKSMLSQGVGADKIINQSIMITLQDVGEKFSAGEAFIPEMLIAARTAQKVIEILRPKLEESGVKPLGKVIIGTVQGDLHDLGKNIVTMMLKGGGFKVQDLGVDVKPAAFIEAIKTHKPEILALSCLLTTTMASVPLVINAIKEAGLRDQVKIMIGGPPTSDAFAQAVGADFFGKDAHVAVQLARKIVGVA
ncbi:MAG: cobalamin-binding protein [Deltaproteobacteria bacterium]|nr:MAG: cobalamin-binding protein [Deltaproteobacteria bacterium]RPJ12176.1 MAG: cobalamin-binding protein [Deltaproteobacteria bacterium]RPJ15348.1 MAG: cobalamin-binding protein [Deltaproteobacteria bacterium]